MSQITLFLALAFAVLIAIFAVQNTTSVQVQFLTFRAEGVAVSVLVLVAAALGALIMLLVSLAREVGARWRQRSLNQQLRASQAKVAALEAAASASSTQALATTSEPVMAEVVKGPTVVTPTPEPRASD